MVKEIYIRDESDPNYEEGILEYSNDIESAISQVRMILGTKPGDVLAEPSFGIDLEYLVFSTIKDSMHIQKLIDDQLAMYVHTGKNITLNTSVNFGDSGRGYDYAIVDIIINGTKALGILVNKE